MSLTTDIPAPFAEMLRSIPGLDAEALLSALDTPPSVAIRLNRRKPSDLADAGYEDATPVDWCAADGRYLPLRPNFTLNPLIHAGGFYVQDASSMIHQQVVERIADSLGGRPLSLLDFCAAPGGKTTAMINALPEGSVVTANEYTVNRGKILRENLEKWGYPSVITTGAAAEDYAALMPIFDVVAVDAPCSGEGMMRKDEDARRQWSHRLVKDCAALQREILQGVATSLRPGGYLIYSTCTFNLEEDEINARFIRDELGLQPVAPADLHIEGIAAPSPALLPGVEALRFMPHLTDGEGLFISIFRKPGEHTHALESMRAATTAAPAAERPRKKGKNGKGDARRTALTDAMTLTISRWFLPEYGMQLETAGDLITALPAAATPILAEIRKAGIRVTGAGLPAAEIKGADPVPDSRIALSVALNQNAFPAADLTEEEALRYLRREAITLPETTPRGYVVVRYAGLPLGMMKNIGNRANNLFPAPWRIKI